MLLCFLLLPSYLVYSCLNTFLSRIFSHSLNLSIFYKRISTKLPSVVAVVARLLFAFSSFSQMSVILDSSKIMSSLASSNLSASSLTSLLGRVKFRILLISKRVSDKLWDDSSSWQWLSVELLILLQLPKGSSFNCSLHSDFLFWTAMSFIRFSISATYSLNVSIWEARF